MSKITGFSTERNKPFPVTKLDFSRNAITSAGIGAVVQFARTQGADATHIDLSQNKLDDKAAVEEVTRLVKNYSSQLTSNPFVSTLLLSGNSIGRLGTVAAPPHLPATAPHLCSRARGVELPPPRLPSERSTACRASRAQAPRN